MLNNLFLGNFKSFGGGPHRAPLSRLTLIVGPNTAGKSALLQSLLLLKQNATEPLDFAGEADLGSYENVVHKHQLRVGLQVGVAWDAGTLNRWEGGESEHIFRRAACRYQEMGLSMTYANFSRSGGARIDDRPRLSAFQYFVYDRSAQKTHNVNLERPRHVEQSERSKRRVLVADSDSLMLGTEEDIHEFLTFARQVYRTDPSVDNRKRFRAAKIDAALRHTFWAGERFSGHSMVPTVASFEQESLGAPISLGDRFPELQPCLSGLRGMADSFEFVCSSIHHVGPIRPRQDRHQLARFAEYFMTQARKSNIHRVSEADVSRIANEILSRLGVAYRLKMSEKYTRAAGLTYQCELIDQRTQTKINPIDTGSGISQVLPLIAVLAVADRSIVLVEQPELHLHPRLQAGLAEEMALPSTSPPMQRQWLVETHSELFILRVQKLIRQGKLSPDDVSVLYVGQEQGSGSYIQQLNIDANGDFIDEWPDGFFEDGYREMFGDDS